MDTPSQEEEPKHTYTKIRNITDPRKEETILVTEIYHEIKKKFMAHKAIKITSKNCRCVIQEMFLNSIIYDAIKKGQLNYVVKPWIGTLQQEPKEFSGSLDPEVSEQMKKMGRDTHRVVQEQESRQTFRVGRDFQESTEKSKRELTIQMNQEQETIKEDNAEEMIRESKGDVYGDQHPEQLMEAKIFMELYSYNLHEAILYNKNTNLSLDEAILIMFQCLVGLAGLRQQGILHIDIKPSNILISDKLDVCFIDFGSSDYIDPKKNESSRFDFLSFHFSSPEFFKYKLCGPEQENTFLTFKHDVWCLGLVFYLLYQKILLSVEKGPIGNDCFEEFELHNFEKPIDDKEPTDFKERFDFYLNRYQKVLDYDT